MDVFAGDVPLKSTAQKRSVVGAGRERFGREALLPGSAQPFGLEARAVQG